MSLHERHWSTLECGVTGTVFDTCTTCMGMNVE